MGQEDTNGSGRRDAGDRLTYTYVVHNTGNTDLHDVAVSDPTTTAPLACPRATLAAGAILTCTSASRLTQADLDTSTVTRAAASVSSHDPVMAAVTATSGPASVVLREIASLNAVQWYSLARDRNHDGNADAGDGVVFRLTVVNSGNVSVTSLAVYDNLLARFGLLMTCTPTSLSPGQKAWCVSPTFDVTNAAAVRGEITNWATPSAVTARGTAFSSSTSNVSFAVSAKTTAVSRSSGAGGASSGVPAKAQKPQQPQKPRTIRKLTLTQYRLSYDDVNGNGAFTAGETFRLGFAASNEGNTTLYGLAVVDDRLAGAKVAISCETTTLSPGQSTTCSSDPISITAFQGKVDQGFGTSFAYATARDASSVAVRSNSTQLYQGYFISDLRVSALPATGSSAAQGLSAAGLGLVGLGGLMFLLSRSSVHSFVRSRLRRARPFDEPAAGPVA